MAAWAKTNVRLRRSADNQQIEAPMHASTAAGTTIRRAGTYSVILRDVSDGPSQGTTVRSGE
jgi:hypothetical protein